MRHAAFPGPRPVLQVQLVRLALGPGQRPWRGLQLQHHAPGLPSGLRQRGALRGRDGRAGRGLQICLEPDRRQAARHQVRDAGGGCFRKTQRRRLDSQVPAARRELAGAVGRINQGINPLQLDPKYFKRLLESSPDIIIAVDKDGTVNYYNEGARTSLGYNSEEIIGENCTRIYTSLEEARRVMKAMREGEGGRIAGFETEFRNKSGDLIPVMVSGALIHDDDGNEVGSIGFARDIRRLRHAQQLATAGEIAVSLAHEINNPLESITNNLELLSQCMNTYLSESEKVVENERLDSIRG